MLPGISGLKNSIERWIFDENDDEVIYGSKRKYQRGQEDRLINVKNPLDHLALAEQVQTEFNNAYRDVILDEYCAVYDDDDEEVEDFMKKVPIVGIWAFIRSVDTSGIMYQPTDIQTMFVNGETQSIDPVWTGWYGVWVPSQQYPALRR